MSRSASPFIDSIVRFMSVRRYSPRTIEAYLYWIRYYIHVLKRGARGVRSPLSDLNKT